MKGGKVFIVLKLKINIMYNTKFLHQLERFRKYLWRRGVTDTRQASAEAHERYSVPNEVQLVPCEEDENGEWVPIPHSELEEVVETSND